MSDRLNRSMALLDAKADVKMIKERANDCWYDTKILANAVYLILEELTTADRKTEPQYDFSEYADRLWKIAYERGKREALAKDEPQTCSVNGRPYDCGNCEYHKCMADEPQTERKDK